MYCRSCGCKLEPEARFCRSCGAPAPEPQPVQPVVQILTPEQPAEQMARKPSGGWGKFFFGLLAGVLCCAIAVGVFALCRKGGAETKLEGSGFDSPEAAMQAYLDGLLNGDAESNLQLLPLRPLLRISIGRPMPSDAVCICRIPASPTGSVRSR